jgi:hypothetical protein
MPYTISSGVRQEGHETDQSPPRAKVKKEWSYTSTPHDFMDNTETAVVKLYLSNFFNTS